MNCETFETLMADALGGELAESDRASFDGHLAFCAKCRGEFESMERAVRRMRSLPGSDRVGEGMAQEAGEFGRLGLRRSGAVYRYAASILVAFAAGYLWRGERGSVAPTTTSSVEQPAATSGQTLETALVSAHRKRPTASALSAAMTAMFSKD